MQTTGRLFAGVLIFSLCLASGAPALAGEEKDGSGWEFTIIPYLWLTGMDADVTVRGAEGSVSSSVGDLWSVEEYGGSVYLEARKGRWAFIVDGVYVNEAFESDPPAPPIETDVKRATGELSLAYRPSFLGPVEVVAGALFSNVDVTVGNDALEASVDDNWLDPLAGLRLRKDLGEEVSFQLRGDVGGFDLNDAFGWRLVVELDLHLTEHLFFATAYMFRSLDYETDRLKVDVKLNGVALGLGYQF